VDGKPKKAHRKTKSKADKLKREKEHQADTGLYIDDAGGKTRLSDYIEDTWWPTKTDLKANTRDGYQRIIRLAINPRFGNRPLARITSVEVERWLLDLKADGKSASWIRQAHTILGQILGHAYRHTMIARNPVTGIRTPPATTRQQARYITAEEVKAIASTVDDRYRTLILTMGYVGLRWAEAVGLQRQDFNPLKRRLHIRRTLSEVNGHFHPTSTKNRRDRQVALPTFLTKDLNSHLATYTAPDADALVFTTPTGAPIRNSNFRRRVWRPALAEAKVESLKLHELRHSAASIMAALGWSLVEVQRQLGHSSLVVTADVYSHLWDEDRDELADRLDQLHTGTN
jgi:integrase